MLKVGITGGIGSGKSTVSRLFSLLNIPLFNSDLEAKKIVLQPFVQEKIVALLGKDAYNFNGSYNTLYVSQQVFSNKDLLAQLNAIIHPAVKNAFTHFCTFHKDKKYILKESALLVETGLYTELDKLIIVVTPLDLRIKRIKQRENWTEKEVLKRIQSQLSDDDKIKLSDFIIFNNEQKSIIKQVLAIHKQLAT